MDSRVHYRQVDYWSVSTCRRKSAASSSERRSQGYRDARGSWGVIWDRRDPPRPRRCCGKRIDISCRRTGRNPSPSDTPCWGPSRTVDTADHQNHFACHRSGLTRRQSRPGPICPPVTMSIARMTFAHLKRGEHSPSGFRNDHLGAQLMKLLPERLRLQSGASTEQRRMERPFRARFLGGGTAVLARMVITVVTVIVVAVVARFHRGRRGNRIRRARRVR